MPFWGNSFSIFGDIKSMPDAFFEFKSPISSFISFGVMSFMGSTVRAGNSRYSSVSLSVSSACGWNTSASCFADTVPFSLSLFAHFS
jgi:hypothetical protein